MHPIHTAFFNEDDFFAAIDKRIDSGIERSSIAMYATFQRCMEKGLYTSIGFVAALCGCYLTTTGVKRTFCEKNKIKSGFALTCTGAVGVFLGLCIATIPT